MIVVRPDVRDAGFILTFGATLALLEGAPRRQAAAARWDGVVGRRVGLGVLAVEVALLPVSALLFSRVTGAGVMLNWPPSR